MKLISTILAICLIGTGFAYDACVTVDSSTGTYTVDPSGSILKQDKEKNLVQIHDRFYVAFEEVDSNDDAFHIHVGENLWIETNSLHRDGSGFYTYEMDIHTINGGYEKKWRCPYCNNYWPIGSTCKNPDCPSKYKG